MPARLVVSLEAIEVPSGRTWADTGPAVHAALLDAVGAIDPAASEMLHGPALRPKPFAITPLLRGPRPGAPTFEIGVVDDEWVEVIAAALDERSEIRVGRSRFEIARIDGYVTSFEELLAGATTATGWKVELRTPAMWSSSNRGTTRRREVLPVPDLLFGSLARRWRRTGGVLPADIELAVEDHVDVRFYELRTARHLTKAPSTYSPGAVGAIEYICVGPRLDDEVLRALSALLRFGQYAGVGDQTTKGMGVMSVTDLDPRGSRPAKPQKDERGAKGRSSRR